MLHYSGQEQREMRDRKSEVDGNGDDILREQRLSVALEPRCMLVRASIFPVTVHAVELPEQVGVENSRGDGG